MTDGSTHSIFTYAFLASVEVLTPSVSAILKLQAILGIVPNLHLARGNNLPAMH